MKRTLCKRKKFSSRLDFLLSYLSSVSITLLLLSFVHFPAVLPACLFVLAAIALPWLLLCGPLRIGKRFSLTACAICAGLFLSLLGIQAVDRYMDTHDGQSDYFRDRSALVLVPHQDDEMLILSGILDRYQDAGEITVAFMTNGDCFSGKSSERLEESISALRLAGIPEKRIVFLGYGDQWDTPYQHIYFAPENEVLRSRAGETRTYGIDGRHAPFRSSDYTRVNLVSDLRALITDVHPDVIYCIDFDDNIDHRALSLLFEEVMGQLLREDDSYRPLVFKGFSYDTAMDVPAPADWINIPSSTLAIDLPYSYGNNTYLWERRVRLPISRKAAVQNETHSVVQRMSLEYKSQAWSVELRRVMRGDKVFWRRYTDGVQYHASFSVSSGDADRLHDFKLLDMRGQDQYPCPTDGTWVPDNNDALRTVTVAFEAPETLVSIILYDNPSLEGNVLNARIEFSDGSHIDTGALLPSGAGTEISFAPKQIDRFTVQITDSEGNACGFTEIEAYAAPHPADRPFVKLMDANGDFAYHYDLQGAENTYFHLYEYSIAQTPDPASAYTLNTTGSISARWENGTIQVTCPTGKRGRLTVRSKDAPLFDSIEILNRPEGARWDAETNPDLGLTFFRFYSFQNLHRQSKYYRHILYELGQIV